MDEAVKEIIEAAKEVIKMSGTVIAQTSETLSKKEELVRRLIKLVLMQCIIYCTAFSITIISLAIIYFIGYSNYPGAEGTEGGIESVGKDNEDCQKDLTQETQSGETTKVREECTNAN